MRWCVVLSVLAACEFPTPSESYKCRTTSDCESGRVCDVGYCVVGSLSNAPDAPTTTPPSDSGVDAALPVDADPFTAIAAQCVAAGYTMNTAAGGYYRTINAQSSWTNAATDCANDVVGATHLIVLSSTAEVTYMTGQLGWIGLSDRVTEGTFVNVTNEAGDRRPWASGQPDNGGGNEDCAQMKGAGLDDDQCGNAHRYVCECDGTPPTP